MNLDALRPGDAAAAAAVAARQTTLTKPPGSLGRLEQLVAWLARWQGRATPTLDTVAIVVFAGNHGVVAHGVSPYPATVTAQMVANFAAGGAAINQIACIAGASLTVVPLSLDQPVADIVTGPAMTEIEFATAWNAGAAAVQPGTDLLCLGEMGIGNTTAAAALCTALFGGGDWTGLGTGVDPAGLARKQTAVAAAASRHAGLPPLEALRCLGGREMVAIAGAVSAARARQVPVLLDGFVCTAAAAPLAIAASGALDHCTAAHVSAEAAHRRLLACLALDPLLDLGMRLGEASGAALAVPLLRAALACHTGMATFAGAAVAGRL